MPSTAVVDVAYDGVSVAARNSQIITWPASVFPTRCHPQTATQCIDPRWHHPRQIDRQGQSRSVASGSPSRCPAKTRAEAASLVGPATAKSCGYIMIRPGWPISLRTFLCRAHGTGQAPALWAVAIAHCPTANRKDRRPPPPAGRRDTTDRHWQSAFAVVRDKLRRNDCVLSNDRSSMPRSGRRYAT